MRSIEEDVSSSEKEISSTEQETSSTEQETSSTEQETSSTEQKTSSTEKETFLKQMSSRLSPQKIYLHTVRNAPEGEAVGSVHLTPDWPAAGVRLNILPALHISRILKRNEDMNSLKIGKDLINKWNPGIASVLFFVQWPCIMQMIYRHCDTDKYVKVYSYDLW